MTGLTTQSWSLSPHSVVLQVAFWSAHIKAKHFDWFGVKSQSICTRTLNSEPSPPGPGACHIPLVVNWRFDMQSYIKNETLGERKSKREKNDVEFSSYPFSSFHQWDQGLLGHVTTEQCQSWDVSNHRDLPGSKPSGCLSVSVRLFWRRSLEKAPVKDESRTN